MGTANYSICNPAKGRGSGAPTIVGKYIMGGAHTTSTTASNLTDGAAGAGSTIQAPVGSILSIVVDEPVRILVGGTPTASNGHYLPANIIRDFEITVGGPIGIIDVA